MSQRFSRGKRAHLLALLFPLTHPKLCCSPVFITNLELEAASSDKRSFARLFFELLDRSTERPT